MNVKELMIGDKVQPRGGTTPTAVAGLTSGKIHTIWADGSKHSKDAYYFDPIPLTAEILEKNGFVLDEYGGLTWYDGNNNPSQVYVNIAMRRNGGVRRVNILKHRTSVCVDGCETYFVHELQHALRMCGLNELADNLKV